MCIIITTAALLNSSNKSSKNHLSKLTAIFLCSFICGLFYKSIQQEGPVAEAAMLTRQYLINARARLVNLVEDIADAPIPNPVLLFRNRQRVAELPVVEPVRNRQHMPARQRVLAMNYA